MKSIASYQSDLRRYSYKSEIGITPKKVPFNGQSNNNCLAKKSQISIQSFAQLEGLLVQELKNLSKQVIRMIESSSDFNELSNQIRIQFNSFEKLMQRSLEQQCQELAMLKLQSTQQSQKMQLIQEQNGDLQHKLHNLQYSLNQSPIELSPNIKSKQTPIIGLVTKKPLRNYSYSMKEDTHPPMVNSSLKTEDKENIKGRKTLDLILGPTQGLENCIPNNRKIPKQKCFKLQ